MLAECAGMLSVNPELLHGNLQFRATFLSSEAEHQLLLFIKSNQKKKKKLWPDPQEWSFKSKLQASSGKCKRTFRDRSEKLSER